MSRRTMQRFNTIKDQFMDLITAPHADINTVCATFDIWESNGMIQHIVGKVPDELECIIEMKYTRMECKLITSRRNAGTRKPINCTLLERIYITSVENINYKAVEYIMTTTHYSKHIRKEVYNHSLLISLENKSYNIFSYLTNVLTTVDFVAVFNTITYSIIYDFPHHSRLSKSITHIIQMLMRNSRKVSYESFRDFLMMIICGLQTGNGTGKGSNNRLIQFMLTNMKKYVKGPYNFNERHFGYGGGERHTLFIELVYRGNSDIAMILVDICEKNNIIDAQPIDIRHDNINYIINEGFNHWDKDTNVKFIEWYYLKTNKQFNLIDYINSRPEYEVYMRWYGWALHLRQLLQLVRKYYGKQVAIDLAPYRMMQWNWFESNTVNEGEDILYEQKHMMLTQHIFSYGCIRMVKKVKAHCKFLV